MNISHKKIIDINEKIALSQKPLLGIFNSKVQFEQGQKHLERGHFDLAAMHFSAAIRQQDSIGNKDLVSDAYYMRGLAYELSGKEFEAMNDFYKAVAINKDNYDAHYELGVLFQKNRSINQAIMHYSRMIEIKPQAEIGYFLLGELYFRAGDYKACVNYLTEANHRNPRDGNVWCLLAMAYYHQGLKGEGEEALENAGSSKTLKYYYNEAVGTALEHRGQFEQAMGYFTKGLGYDNSGLKIKLADLRVKNAGLLLVKGELDKAHRELKSALQLDPDNKDAVNLLFTRVVKNNTHVSEKTIISRN